MSLHTCRYTQNVILYICIKKIFFKCRSTFAKILITSNAQFGFTSYLSLMLAQSLTKLCAEEESDSGFKIAATALYIKQFIIRCQKPMEAPSDTHEKKLRRFSCSCHFLSHNRTLLHLDINLILLYRHNIVSQY